MNSSEPLEAEISVIVVNYGAAELAILAVQSVLDQASGKRSIEVHLVDNGSPGTDAAKLSEIHSTRQWGDRVTLWLEKENHGFGRGNNLVLGALAERSKPPKYAFLLNPDAVLENDAIGILSQALDRTPNAAAAGAGISMPDGSRVAAAFRFPNMARELVSTLGLGPLERLFPSARIPLDPNHVFGPVDWVAGAAVLMRFEALVEVGFFDPDFFLYYEEVELMWRIARSGRQVLYVPDARIIHLEGASTGVRSSDAPRRLPPYVYQSWRFYYLKAYGRAYAISTAVLKLPTALANLALSRLRSRAPGVAPGFFSDHWRYVLRPLLMGSSE